ncbi:MAG TPA: hypothetical protein VFP80_09120 [Thermoanaerobaculia bacterium]|nr:hypothetical protein [Thermoanaerobaculia bacterium]
MKRLLLVLFAALPSFAQVLTDTPHGVVVAHDGRIEWGGRNVAGVENATAITADADRAVVLDALKNQAVVVDLARGTTQRIRTAETPIAAVFARGELYILARDARVLQRVGGEDIPLDADPSHLAQANGRVFVYSRTAGVLREIGGGTVQVPPFASDLEIAGERVYLAYPREGKIRIGRIGPISPMSPIRPIGPIGPMTELVVGAVPTDLAFAGGGTALTARILAVADPSAKRVWLAESTQSTTEAVARGFLRGLLGLGLFGSRASQFPTGVDRVETRGKHWIAYDSSSRTLYHFTRRQSTVLVRGVAPGAFALTENGVAWWNGTSVAEKELR